MFIEKLSKKEIEDLISSAYKRFGYEANIKSVEYIRPFGFVLAQCSNNRIYLRDFSVNAEFHDNATRLLNKTLVAYLSQKFPDYKKEYDKEQERIERTGRFI